VSLTSCCSAKVVFRDVALHCDQRKENQVGGEVAHEAIDRRRQSVGQGGKRSHDQKQRQEGQQHDPRQQMQESFQS